MVSVLSLAAAILKGMGVPRMPITTEQSQSNSSDLHKTTCAQAVFSARKVKKQM
jgi:hypothetical protein